MEELPSFSRLAGLALIVLAAVVPLTYCEIQDVSTHELVLACIQGKGEWKAEGWGPYTCHWPKPLDNSTAQK